MAGAYLFSNHAVSELAGDIGAAVTELTVKSGEGAKFPAQNFKIQMGSEIVLVGSRSGDSFSSLTRGWENTTAVAHSATDPVRHLFTAEDYLVTPRDSHIDLWYRRPTDETPHSMDDEYDGASTVTWSEYTPSGTVNWNQDNDKHVLTADYENQSSGHAAIRTQDISSLSGPPVTIETLLYIDQHNANYAMAGLIFTDGETSGSNAQSVMPYVDGNSRVLMDVGRNGTLTAMGNAAGQRIWHSHPTWIHWRLVWTGVDTWEAGFSFDGRKYFGWTGLTTSGFTPTRAGTWVTSWGGTLKRYAAFQYFRLTEADLGAL